MSGLKKNDLRILLKVEIQKLWDIVGMLIGGEYGGINELDIWRN